METVRAARPSAVYYWGVHVQGSVLSSHVDHFQASGLHSSRRLAALFTLSPACYVWRIVNFLPPSRENNAAAQLAAV